MKTITIQVPDDCEVQIVKKEEKKKEPTIRTFQDLIDNHIKIGGWWINAVGKIEYVPIMPATSHAVNRAVSVKVAKHMLAAAMISHLMPYYGGAITDKEQKSNSAKFVIDKRSGIMYKDIYYGAYSFLAFHTREQRDEFLRYNEQLVKDYLMIE